MAHSSLRNVKKLFLNQLKELYPVQEVESIFKICREELANIAFSASECANDCEISNIAGQEMLSALSGLKEGKPVQYVLGVAHFYDLKFTVNEAVLIPRQETEVLIYELLKILEPQANSTIIDIGTGSGCIAISLKKNLPNTTVYATDYSLEALQVAKQNAELNNTSVTFLHDDIFSSKVEKLKKFDVVVSNPPYVMEKEKSQMHANVLEYEPELALFVEDNDALKYYKAIVEFTCIHLNDNGLLAVEINEALANETAKLFSDYGFEKVSIIKDLNNKDRFIIARR